MAQHAIPHYHLVWFILSSYWTQPLVAFPWLIIFHLSLLLFVLSQLFLCTSHIFLSYALLSPFHTSPHLYNLWILLNGYIFSLFLLSLIFATPPHDAKGFYSAIRSGSMRINSFSTNNIFIQSIISSSIHLLGPYENFLSSLLKESMYSTMNSTM
jgi:hypothetical protein